MPSHARADAIPLHDRPRPSSRALVGSSSSSPPRARAGAFALLLVAATLATLLARSSWRPLVAPPPPSRGPGGDRGRGDDVSCAGIPPYVVVVDAGSTGSRAHAFRVVPDAASPPAFALEPVGDKVTSDVPLASVAGAPAARVAAAILPALRETARRIPARDARRTPAYVWATAGVRALPLAAQTALWADVEALVREETPFAFGPPESFSSTTSASRDDRRSPAETSSSDEEDADGSSAPSRRLSPARASRLHFRTVSGEDEGFFAWLAANALRGVDLTRVGSRGADVPALLARTVGAVDVGGGSAQIVAMPAGAGDAAATLDDVRAAVYAASHLGVGAKFLERRLRDRVVRAAADAGDADAAYPCGPRGWEATHALAAAEEEGAAGEKTRLR